MNNINKIRIVIAASAIVLFVLLYSLYQNSVSERNDIRKDMDTLSLKLDEIKSGAVMKREKYDRKIGRFETNVGQSVQFNNYNFTLVKGIRYLVTIDNEPGGNCGIWLLHWNGDVGVVSNASLTNATAPYIQLTISIVGDKLTIQGQLDSSPVKQTYNIGLFEL